MAEKEGIGMTVEMTKPQSFEISSRLLHAGEYRLNAAFYSQDVIAARLILTKLTDKGIQTTLLGDLADEIFMPALKINIPFDDYGEPYLTQSEVEFFLPRARKHVNTSKLQDPERWYVDSGTILISQSGTIGRASIASGLLREYVISPNPIRLIARDDIRGYLYAFLSSWIGSALVKSPRYGVTVDHILPHHLYNVAVPRLPWLESEINRRVIKASLLREEAQGCLLEAEHILLSQLELPDITEDNHDSATEAAFNNFETMASELNSRLDASYHIPSARLAVKNLTTSLTGTALKLADISRLFVPPRFKRVYVDNPSDGVPLLQGTHIPQITPRDVKYISKSMKNLESYVIRRNWILATCSGTIGRLSLVGDYWDGWTATNHLLRIIPDDTKINPGYLATFLISAYGQAQFHRLIYGGVVDEIGEAGELFNDILVLKPKNRDIENSIGTLTLKAYKKKDQSNVMEYDTIALLERELENAIK